jgi:aminoglycoside phosphotransferase (APT) family kinase protein
VNDASGLAPEFTEWLAKVAGGPVHRVERAVARREAWLVDAGPDGETQRLFVRLARPADPANGREGLLHEAAVVAALADSPVPVPHVRGVDPALGVVAYEFVAGSSDLQSEAPDQQQAVYRHYLECLATLHRLDLDATGLDLPRPATPEACALASVDEVAAAMGPLITEPLATFGVSWLRRNAPRSVEHVSLLHGDAGTPNFVYDGRRVSALIDWEWAHIGDPMEDLGNTCVHASFHPSGNFAELLSHYERVSGLPVDIDRVRYYRAHLMVRSVLALAAVTARWDPHVPVALNLCFRVISDRICCDAIAEAMGIKLERPELPFVPEPDVSLYDVVVANLREDVVPSLPEAFARNRAETAALLVAALEREHRIGPAVAEIELEELAELLGRYPEDLGSGLAELDRAATSWPIDREEELLRYLGRRAWRTEQLLRPVVSLFPDVELRPIN